MAIDLLGPHYHHPQHCRRSISSFFVLGPSSPHPSESAHICFNSEDSLWALFQLSEHILHTYRRRSGGDKLDIVKFDCFELYTFTGFDFRESDGMEVTAELVDSYSSE